MTPHLPRYARQPGVARPAYACPVAAVPQVGMHGAALTHALFLPPWGAVLEMWPKTREMWRCFEHWSQLGGHAYERYENTDPHNFNADKNGDYTRIEPEKYMTHFRKLVSWVTGKRTELASLATRRGGAP